MHILTLIGRITDAIFNTHKLNSRERARRIIPLDHISVILTNLTSGRSNKSNNAQADPATEMCEVSRTFEINQEMR
ncbi:hypothetical protein CEXT_563891 [Caerostris extrusa]|uniref:Uncharacterized protein n=1 Tax=Caerostris extrusa TaxID=172846 RepID=A0AAV4XJX4_CAEEX|nr:hypothetical protein CEXT_563891 [Caerostris extrusa]